MTGPGLRERKKQETRATIAHIALALACEHGPDGVTVDDIAAAAGVSPRTVFNHFGTKDEAILGIDPERRAQLLDEVRARPADEPPLRALVGVFAEAMTADEASLEFWLRRAELVRQHPGLRAAQLASQAELEHDLAAVVAERTGLDADDPYPELLVGVTLTAIRQALARSATAGPTQLARALDAVAAALEGGLTPPRPRTSRRS